MLNILSKLCGKTKKKTPVIIQIPIDKIIEPGPLNRIQSTENESSLTLGIKEEPTTINTEQKKLENHDLIVDDSDPNRIVLKKYLNRYGRSADEAINGEDAIEKIKKIGSYKIVWMDIQMPKMNGIKCTKQLRDLGYKGCIIGLTGHIDEESVSNCKQAGMQDILAKPIDKKVLSACIDQYKKL
jgi:CheY-like chemotaxis protein